MAQQKVLRQRDWTVEELAEEGFRYYPRRRQVVMARALPAAEAPLTIETEWDTLTAEAGYMICFRAGEAVRDSLYDYEHWPVQPDHFADLYEPWDEPGWEPTPAQQHLMSLGCQPWCNTAGVWAKKLTEATLVQSVESAEPARVPAGAWLCIASEGSAWGAPYSMDDASFEARFEPEPQP